MRPAAIASLLVVGVAAGYGVRYLQRASTDPAEIALLREDSEKYQILKTKLGHLADHDLEDYVRLKGLEAKYKKADEILSKITLIFLADLGIRLSDRQVRFAQHPEEIAAKEPAPRLKISASASDPPPATTAAAQPGTQPMWRQVEKNARYLKPGDADWFLKKVEIPDFGGELNRATNLQIRDSRIEGCYSGTARLSDGRTWQLKTAVSFTDGTPLTATTSVQAWENGNMFINSSGSGQITDIQTLAGGGPAIILEASSTTYFQLYPTTDQSILVGNVYVRNGDTRKFMMRGTLLLERQECRNG